MDTGDGRSNGLLAQREHILMPCLRACSTPLCKGLTPSGKCAACKTQVSKERFQSAEETGIGFYGRKWRRARAAFLRERCQVCLGISADCELCHGCSFPNRFCVQCWTENQWLNMGNLEVDHIVPHQGDPGKFWNRRNWQTLCAHHHSVKTATEDGGFGNRRRPMADPPVLADGNTGSHQPFEYDPTVA